jgi:hypothetical protein
MREYRKLRLIKPWHLRAMPLRLNNDIGIEAVISVTCKGPCSFEEFSRSNRLPDNRLHVSFDTPFAGRDFYP